MKKITGKIETLVPDVGMVPKYKTLENVFAEQLHSGTISEDEWIEVSRAEHGTFLAEQEKK